MEEDSNLGVFFNLYIVLIIPREICYNGRMTFSSKDA